MKVAHLTTVDLSLRYLVLPQLLAIAEAGGDAMGISARGPYVPELEELGIRHISLEHSTRGWDPLADLKAAYSLWRILREERPDVLHTHNPKPGVYGRIVGRMAGVPVVVNTTHGLYATADDRLAKRAVVYGLEWLASRFSHVELVQNHEDVDLMKRLRLVSKSKLGWLGNGVDLGRFNPGRAASSRRVVRKELGVEPAQIVVGSVGRLVAEKGYAELLEVASRLPPSYVVVIAGPNDPDKADSLDSAMLKQAESHGVRFLGMRQDVDRLYGAFDMFVLPSHREGFPRAAMEAAASGLAVIATDIRGCRQVVDNGTTGLLVPVRNPDQLEAAILRVGSDVAARSSMGEAAMRKAAREFDENLVVERVMAAYRQTAEIKGLGILPPAELGGVSLRPARRSDAGAIAYRHRQGIDSGFLSTLGQRFLESLYRALIDFTDSEVLVAIERGGVVGFVAGCADTAAFYRWFLRRRGIGAGLAALPHMLNRSQLVRVTETLRHSSVVGAGEVRAELLSLAVDARLRGHGVGRRLVDELLVWSLREGLGEMRVVVGATNQPAIRLYEGCGFSPIRTYELHAGDLSVDMKWTAPGVEESNSTWSERPLPPPEGNGTV